MKIIRPILALLFLILLVEFPRGSRPGNSGIQVSSPVPHFSWTSYIENVSDLWHRIANGTFGLTVDGLQPIATVVAASIGPTAKLLGIGLLLTLIIGVGKGLYDGLSKSSRKPANIASGVIQWLIESIPEFFLLIALEWFGFYLNRHGVNVYFVGSQQFVSGTFAPALIIAALPAMYMARMVRNAVDEQFGQQYLVTAEAKGLPFPRIVTRHVLPNVLPTVLRSTVAALGMMISSLVIVEYLYAIPGVVGTLFQAMGHTGSNPTFMPTGDPPSGLSYRAFDPQLTLALIITLVLLFALFTLVINGLLWLTGYRGQINPYTNILKSAPSRLPWQLPVGTVMFAGLFIIGLVSSWLPMWNPWKFDSIEFDASGAIHTPPFSPSKVHWLGTDETGYDLFSRVIHGIVPTYLEVAIATLCVVLVAALVAVLATVWRIQFLKRLIDFANLMFTMIPGVIGALLILEIPDLFWFGANFRTDHITWPWWHILVYLAVIVLVEFGRTAKMISSVLSDTLQQSHMEAAEIAGNSTWTRFVIHCVYPLRQAVIEQSVAGFSRIMILMATLGFFHLPIYQEYHTVMAGFSANWVFASHSLDWSSIMSENARDFIPYFWMLTAPIVFVTYTIMAVSLIQSGIRIKISAQAERTAHRTNWGLRMAGWFVRDKRSASYPTKAQTS